MIASSLPAHAHAHNEQAAQEEGRCARNEDSSDPEAGRSKVSTPTAVKFAHLPRASYHLSFMYTLPLPSPPPAPRVSKPGPSGHGLKAQLSVTVPLTRLVALFFSPLCAPVARRTCSPWPDRREQASHGGLHRRSQLGADRGLLRRRCRHQVPGGCRYWSKSLNNSRNSMPEHSW